MSLDSDCFHNHSKPIPTLINLVWLLCSRHFQRIKIYFQTNLTLYKNRIFRIVPSRRTNSHIRNYYGRDDIWPNRKFRSSFIWFLLHIEPKMPFKIYFFQINNLHKKSQPETVIFLGHFYPHANPSIIFYVFLLDPYPYVAPSLDN